MILKKSCQNCFNLDSCSRFEARHWKKEILILKHKTGRNSCSRLKTWDWDWLKQILVLERWNRLLFGHWSTTARWLQDGLWKAEWRPSLPSSRSQSALICGKETNIALSSDVQNLSLSCHKLSTQWSKTPVWSAACCDRDERIVGLREWNISVKFDLIRTHSSC